MQNVLRIWLSATALFIVCAMIWAFAPVLVPAIGITFGLGGVVAGIVWLARRLERARGGAGPEGPGMISR